LKTVKFWRFARSGPFSQIRLHINSTLQMNMYTLGQSALSCK